MGTLRKLASFSGAGYIKGKPIIVQALWLVTSAALVERIWCPAPARVAILRLFGAKIGTGVLIRHGVRVHWPWKLEIGDNVWIGVDAWLLNLEFIRIGSDVCISQGVMLCTGSHDARSPSFEFDNGPIHVQNGAWIAARATVLRGVTIGENAIVGATGLVTQDVPEGARTLAPRASVVGEGLLR